MYEHYSFLLLVMINQKLINPEKNSVKGIEHFSQTQIFLSLYLCNLMLYPLDISSLVYYI